MPLFIYRGGAKLEESRYWIEHELKQENVYPAGAPWKPDLQQLREEFERISGLSGDQAARELQKMEEADTPFQRVERFCDYRVYVPSATEVSRLLDSLDPRGAWLTTIEFRGIHDFLRNPPRVLRGIDTGAYVAHMYRLIRYLGAVRSRAAEGNSPR